ncbi:MAG: hypothetical protein AAF518_03055 [Spirochaetota bacterium]
MQVLEFLGSQNISCFFEEEDFVAGAVSLTWGSVLETAFSGEEQFPEAKRAPPTTSVWNNFEVCIQQTNTY